MIDRIWYGPEREGFDKGVLTAFIEAEHITDADLDFVCEKLKANRLTRAYFGANERDLLSAPSDFIKRLKGIEVFIETSIQNLLNTLDIACKGSRVILRQWLELPTEQLMGIQFKFRNQNDIFIYKDSAHTSTAEIRKGLYTTVDKLLYDANE